MARRPVWLDSKGHPEPGAREIPQAVLAAARSSIAIGPCCRSSVNRHAAAAHDQRDPSSRTGWWL